jgi:hypothetical protein
MNASKVRAGGALALGILFIPFALFARANDGFTEGGAIPCIWRSLTGYPCPGCGLTRAFASLTEFDIAQSIRFNPEALLFTALFLFALIAPQQLIAIKERFQRWSSLKSNKNLFISALVVFGLLWIVNIIRVSTGFYPTT